MLNWNWALNVKLELGFDVNVKLELISMQFDFSRVASVKTGP